MAQAPSFKSSGSLEVEIGRAYTKADLPTVPTTPIDTIKISSAPLLWNKVYNQKGKIEQENGIDKFVKGNQRGVHILITRSGVTYGAGADANVPSKHYEKDEIPLHDDNTYIFLTPCTIEYGNL